jgi:hypothetical protein
MGANIVTVRQYPSLRRITPLANYSPLLHCRRRRTRPVEKGYSQVRVNNSAELPREYR